MKVGISLTDLSGEHHVALLLDKLKTKLSSKGETLASFGLGSERLSAFGAELFEDIGELSSIGIGTGLKNVLGLMCRLKTTPAGIVNSFTAFLLDRNPDVVLLVDSRALNLKVARNLRIMGFQGKIVYYVAPVRWESCYNPDFFQNARNLKRFADFKSNVDYFIPIYPVSLEAYEMLQMPYTFIGHPMAELVDNARTKEAMISTVDAEVPLPPDAPWVGLFPGSRTEEFKLMLPTLIKAISELNEHYRDLHYVIAVARKEFEPALRTVIGMFGLSGKCTLLGSEYAADIVKNSDALICKSGTVLHLAALACTPAIMVYEVSRIQAWLARKLMNFDMPFYALPNLVVNRQIVPELVGDKFNAHRIGVELSHILFDCDKRQRMLEGLREVRTKLVRDNPLDNATDLIIRLCGR